MRRNDLKMDKTLDNGTFELSSKYNAQTTLASASLVGMINLGKPTTELWPELSLVHGVTRMGDIRFQGTAYGLTDNNLILNAGSTSLSKLVFSPELRVALDATAVASSSSMLNLAPRFICERTSAEVSSRHCGQGVQLRYKAAWNKGARVMDTIIRSDIVGGVKTTSLNLGFKFFY